MRESRLQLQVRLLVLALTCAALTTIQSHNQDISSSSASSSLSQQLSSSSTEPAKSTDLASVQVSAIFVHKSEFPLSSLLFRLTLNLALDAANKRLESKRLRLLLNIRSANTCSRQYAGAVAAEEFHLRRTRLFVVSGCDDAIRTVSRLASNWRVPVMTAAGFGLDLDNKLVHRQLTRVAFSLRTAVEFLMKILKSLQWRRVNVIVDEQDSNSVALKASIEKHLAEAVSTQLNEFQVSLNVIPIAFEASEQTSLNQSANETRLQIDDAGEARSASQRRPTRFNVSSPQTLANHSAANVDHWPDPLVELSVRESLKQSALFSRINILLVPAHHIRKLMLAAHELGMANGYYSFISLPLLFTAEDNQIDQSEGDQVAGSSGRANYVTSTGENAFQWHSASSSRNAHARRAYESLMSIYLKTPTTKAYVYFVNRLGTAANNAHGSGSHNSSLSDIAPKVRLDVNPYSASFYDCIQIYASILEESLTSGRNSTDLVNHANISGMMKNRRFTNMVTGTIVINSNGDRETDYTLDDLNQQTGKFNPVILYKGETKDIERLARIHWSSDSAGKFGYNSSCDITSSEVYI